MTAARIRWRKVFFRQNRNHLACQAYRQMNLEEFQALNARQAWANWRTIPRNLAGRLPQRPVLALDLCCGVGESTEVLAYYLRRDPPSSGWSSIRPLSRPRGSAPVCRRRAASPM